MMRTPVPAAASVMKRAASASGRTSSNRSSVERIVRETSNVTTIARMNHEAIFTPSGRSITLTTVV